jgi:outer membrane protein insertion porin family
LSKDYAISLNGQADYGHGYGGDPLPVFKNFFAGGIGSVRGYDTSSLGPKDENGDPIGGNKRINGNAEFLFPIPGTGNDRSFRGFLFADGGNVFGPSDKISFANMRYSAGIGLNWLSPLGALRLSFGQPLNAKPGDNIQKLQFTIGSGF